MYVKSLNITTTTPV